MVAQRGTVGTSGAGARAATTGAWRRKSTVVWMSSAGSPVRGAGAADAARGDEHLVDVSCPVEDFGEGLLVSAVTGTVQHGVVGILSQARAVHPGEGGLQPVGVAMRWQPSGWFGWYTGGSGSRVANWSQSGSAGHDGSAGTGLLSDRGASQLHELFGAHRNGAGQKGQRCPAEAEATLR
jgi:hypothetical protein